jgi:chorismate-pyruvate lyase
MAVGGGGVDGVVDGVVGLTVATEAALEKDLAVVADKGLWGRRARVRRRFQAMILVCVC